MACIKVGCLLVFGPCFPLTKQGEIRPSWLELCWCAGHRGANSTAHQKLRWRGAALEGRGPVGEESFVAVLRLSQHALDRADGTLSHAVALRMVRRTGAMLDPLAGQEDSKCMAGVLWTVVGHKYLRDAMASKVG